MNDITMFRREPIRSRKLLDSAHGAPCTMQVPGVCNRDPASVVSAHLHDESFGMGEKADDSSTVHSCLNCHTWLDRAEWLGKTSEADVLRIMLRAMQRTLRYRILNAFMVVDLDKPATLHDRKAKPRKSKELRAAVAPGRPIEGRGDWPKGRKIPGRKMKS